MNTKYFNKDKIYEDAIKIFGEEIQLLVAIEEMSELIQSITHYMRNRNNSIYEIIEELADAEIVIEQLRIIFKEQKNEIDKIKSNKLLRLHDILNRYKNEKK